MRVLCINGDFTGAMWHPSYQYLKETPVELQNYTVVDVREINGRVGYILDEIDAGFFPSGVPISFDSSRFIPVEEINSLEELIEEECLMEVF
jgi:hypothetical protein